MYKRQVLLYKSSKWYVLFIRIGICCCYISECFINISECVWFCHCVFLWRKKLQPLWPFLSQWKLQTVHFHSLITLDYPYSLSLHKGRRSSYYFICKNLFNPGQQKTVYYYFPCLNMNNFLVFASWRRSVHFYNQNLDWLVSRCWFLAYKMATL